LDSLTPKTYP